MSTPAISIITCTGGRPEAYELCYNSVVRQSVCTGIGMTVEWIVVHDDGMPLSTTKIPDTNLTIKHVQGPRTWREGLNTLRYNMEMALKLVEGAFIFIMEDDDYYHRLYLDDMWRNLRYGTSKAVGLGNARYYNVGLPGYKELGNYGHASLSQTAFHKDLLPLMQQAVDSGNLYIDIDFWNRVKAEKLPYALLSNTNLSVGIKGLPGRAGITESHRNLRDFRYDPGAAKLREWIGNDADIYTKFLKGKYDENKNKIAPREQASGLQGRSESRSDERERRTRPSFGNHSSGNAQSITESKGKESKAQEGEREVDPRQIDFLRGA